MSTKCDVSNVHKQMQMFAKEAGVKDLQIESYVMRSAIKALQRTFDLQGLDSFDIVNVSSSE